MLNSLREWGERRSTRASALKIAQKRLELEGAVLLQQNSHKCSHAALRGNRDGIIHIYI